MKFLKFFFDRNGNKNKGDFLIRFQLSLFQSLLELCSLR